MIDLNFFIIPTTTAKGEEIEITNDWTIEVIVNGDTKFTKKLGAREGCNPKLKPGMMHRLPDLPSLTLSSEWDISKWMTYIPRNVYLSEISIPGSWESLNPNFQGTNPSIEDQYKYGCRAFHINCCYQQSTNILGIDDGGPSTERYLNPNNVYMTSSTNPTFASALKSIAGCVSDEEYMVVLCTLRLKAGIPKGHNWMEDIATACSTLEEVYDAGDLTPNTTVGDVLGHVIVIVNCEGEPTELVPEGSSKCVFVNDPLKLSYEDFPADGAYNDKFLYNEDRTSTGVNFLSTQGQVNVLDTSKPYVTMFRGFAPRLSKSFSGTITDYSGGIKWPDYYDVNTGSREKNIQTLLDVSMNSFGGKDYAHDKWYYFGIGGYIKATAEQKPDPEDYRTVATTLNTWFNSRVVNMSPTPTAPQTKLFPVGIVLMNFASVDTYSGSAVNGKTTTVNILKLNNRYHKAFDPSKPAFPVKPKVDESKIEENKTSSRAAADGWD
ncbi:MAG: hypothetical protein HUJ83_08965 [Veillonella sp.]|nr:hypothetical protein [Veillonella sp.]